MVEIRKMAFSEQTNLPLFFSGIWLKADLEVKGGKKIG